MDVFCSNRCLFCKFPSSCLIAISRFLSKTHYEVLGIEKNSTTKEVKEAYVKLCKEIHPDKNPHISNQHNKFIQLNEAYAVLVRPETRSRYDLSLASKKENRTNTTTAYNNSDFSRPFEDRSYDYAKEYEAYNYYRSQNYAQKYKKIRTNNISVVIGCIFIIICGTVFHFATFRTGMTFSEKKLDEKDKVLQSIYSDVKLNAIDGRDTTKITEMHDKLKKNRLGASLSNSNNNEV